MIHRTSTTVDAQRPTQAGSDFAVRWIDTNVRAVPPDADTIIRTITTTIDGVSTSKTHWLEGLRGPPG